MAVMTRIEPVPPVQYEQALVLLTGAANRREAAARAAGFESLLTGPDHSRCDFRWVRAEAGPRCAALTIRNVGATAMIFCSPLSRSGEEAGALVQLLAELSQASLDSGARFVQGLLPLDWEREAALFVRAGYSHLAELAYMQAATAGVAMETCPVVRWHTVLDIGERVLATVIADTYEGSCDCPGLLGLRNMDEVIASHKASGLYHPQSWFVAEYLGESVGCVLVNDATMQFEAGDIVYLGVRPRWRRRGFGRILLRHAMADAANRALRRLLLAADAANVPAMALYHKEGFREVDRRVAYIRSVPKPLAVK